MFYIFFKTLLCFVKNTKNEISKRYKYTSNTTMDNITVISIDETGIISLKNISVKSTGFFDRYGEDAYICSYCKHDGTGRGSQGPYAFPLSIPEDTSYVMNYADSHEENCVCPKNPYSYLFDANCSCGLCEEGNHRGKFFFVKMTGPNGNRIQTNCTQHDVECFMKFIEDQKLYMTQSHNEKQSWWYRTYRYALSWIGI